MADAPGLPHKKAVAFLKKSSAKNFCAQLPPNIIPLRQRCAHRRRSRARALFPKPAVRRDQLFRIQNLRLRNQWGKACRIVKKSIRLARAAAADDPIYRDAAACAGVLRAAALWLVFGAGGRGDGG
jgi:hypothetical protein